MKVSKFKVLLYLKKSNLDKQGKAPIMGRITLNNSMAQFSCKLSCNPNLYELYRLDSFLASCIFVATNPPADGFATSKIDLPVLRHRRTILATRIYK